jgi:hypothetical protein
MTHGLFNTGSGTPSNGIFRRAKYFEDIHGIKLKKQTLKSISTRRLQIQKRENDLLDNGNAKIGTKRALLFFRHVRDIYSTN